MNIVDDYTMLKCQKFEYTKKSGLLYPTPLVGYEERSLLVKGHHRFLNVGHLLPDKLSLHVVWEKEFIVPVAHCLSSILA